MQLWGGLLDGSVKGPDLAPYPDSHLLAEVPFLLVRSDTEPQLSPGIAQFFPFPPNRAEIVIALDTFAQMQKTNESILTNGWPAEDVGYPTIREAKDGEHEIGLDTTVHWPTRRPFVAAINMSFGPRDDFAEFTPLDPVNVATLAVSQLILPVMSAGNAGQLSTGRETMSAWSEAPWVMSVGAAADQAGRQLASYSSAGTPNLPESGPDIVSFGESELDYHVQGTSFAAPRIARCSAMFAAAFFTLRHFVQVVRNEPLEGIPQCGVAYIDNQIHPSSEPWTERALPASGVNLTELAAVLGKLNTLGSQVDVVVTPTILRRLLTAAARPMSYAQHEVGAGFLNYDSAEAFLAGFSGAHLAWFFGSAQLGTEHMRDLAKAPLFDAEALPEMVSIWRRATALWAWDYGEKRFIDIDGSTWTPPVSEA